MKNHSSFHINIPCLFVILCVLCSSWASATQPFDNTFIEKKNGRWHCPDFFTKDLIIADRDENTRYKIALRELFPNKNEYRSNVHPTSAGHLWGKASLCFITNINKTDYFYMHTWNGKRLLIDLNIGKIRNPNPLLPHLNRTETRQIQSLVSRAADTLANNGKPDREEKLHGAMLLAAENRMTNIREFLEKIEKHDISSRSYGYHSQCSYGKSLGMTEPYRIYFHRRFAQITLRRMGFIPKGYPQIVFEKGKESTAVSPLEKVRKARLIETGLSSKQTYRTLGPPDYIQSASYPIKNFSDERWKYASAWRYDIDSPLSHSLIIIWSSTGEIERIEKILPALWHGAKLFSEKWTVRADGSLTDGIYLYTEEFVGKIEVIGSKGDSEMEINKCMLQELNFLENLETP